MALEGAILSLLIGGTPPTPAPAALMDAMVRLTIRSTDEGPSGFELNAQTGLVSGALRARYDLLEEPRIAPGNRMVVTVRIGARLGVLADGIITRTTITPSNQAGDSLLTIMGEDLSILMDRQEKQRTFEALDPVNVVRTVLASYAAYGVRPTVEAPSPLQTPSPLEPAIVQRESDLAFVRRLGERYGFTFYMEPGQVPGVSNAYWGPRGRTQANLSPLLVNVGPATNVESFEATRDPIAVAAVGVLAQDPTDGALIDSESELGSEASATVGSPSALQGRRILAGTSGLRAGEIEARVSGQATRSARRGLEVRGSVDAVRYGDFLRAHRRVEVVGAGAGVNGEYDVSEVDHTIRIGSFIQSFRLTRASADAGTPGLAAGVL